MSVVADLPNDIKKMIESRRNPDDIEVDGRFYRLELGFGFYRLDCVGPQCDYPICNIPSSHDDPEIRKLIVGAALLAYDIGIREGEQRGRDKLKNEFKNLFGL
jgi:hypothetical protein